VGGLILVLGTRGRDELLEPATSFPEAEALGLALFSVFEKLHVGVGRRVGAVVEAEFDPDASPDDTTAPFAEGGAPLTGALLAPPIGGLMIDDATSGLLLCAGVATGKLWPSVADTVGVGCGFC